MLAEVLKANNPAPDNGWYRKGRTQTRFDWKSLERRFDRNHDHALVRDELPCTDAEFNRLDRDRDGRLTKADFDFSPNHVGESFSIQAFATGDTDVDGKISSAEYFTLFDYARSNPFFRPIFAPLDEVLRARLASYEKEHSGFLTLSDFQDAFDVTASKMPPLDNDLIGPVRTKPNPEQFLGSFLRQELGSFGSGPALDAPAPDFSLTTTDGKERISLSMLIGSKPVVLIFGNITCGPFRSHAGSLERLFDRYKDRANFVMVYTRETHPVDGWQLDENRRTGFTFSQPRALPERTALAQSCRTKLRLAIPVVVDTMDDRVATSYGGAPSRLYLIDRQAKIAYKGGRGPFGFKPAELEQSLIFLRHTDP